MDSLTQAVLGAAIQGAGLGKQQGRKALLYGAILATLPDLDVFVRHADPVMQMTLHRSITHSLFVLPVFALLLTLAIRKLCPNPAYSVTRLFVTLCLVLITHPLLDAFTVYGTQLFWPLMPIPQQWSGVFIVDPLYTLPLLFAVLYAAFRGMTPHTVFSIKAALLWSCLYLAWGTIGQYSAENKVQRQLEKGGIRISRIMATPMPANTVLYRVLAKTDNGNYIDAVSGRFDSRPAEYVRQPLGYRYAGCLNSSPQFRRLYWFADGWLRIDRKGDDIVVTDLRMGVPGAHNFRFVMGSIKLDGNCAPITPRRYTSAKPLKPADALPKLWQRTVYGHPSLPLADWYRHE